MNSFDSPPPSITPDSPTTTVRPRPGLPRADRQTVLEPRPLENLLEDSHQARLVWQYVAGIDLSPLCDRIKAVEGLPGRPPAEPAILVSLWLYATLEGIGSARYLDYLCTHHNAFRW